MKKKESKSGSGYKKVQQKPVPAANPQKEPNAGNPRKPLFSKELLIKLLPLIKAFVLWFILVAIVHIPGIRDGFRNMMVTFTTSSTSFIGKILFLPFKQLSPSTLSLRGFTMDIIVECTAYNFYFFAIALAVFANWSIRHKLINLLIFLAVIFFTNILRFFAMGYIGKYYENIFNTAHDYVWNILFGFMIFAVWAWRDKVNNPDFQSKNPQP